MNEPLVVLPLSELEALLRRCVREELAERGYAAEQEILSKEHAAGIFGVSTRTITTWMARDGLPHHKGHGGRLYFKREELAAWSSDHGQPMKGKGKAA